jgi:hypothetical protein
MWPSRVCADELPALMSRTLPCCVSDMLSSVYYATAVRTHVYCLLMVAVKNECRQMCVAGLCTHTQPLAINDVCSATFFDMCGAQFRQATASPVLQLQPASKKGSIRQAHVSKQKEQVSKQKEQDLTKN